MNNNPTPYPLAWPIGWPRTRAGDRERSRFRNARAVDDQLPMSDATSRLIRECRLQGVRSATMTLLSNADEGFGGLSGAFAPGRSPVVLGPRVRIRPQFLRPPRPAACRSSSVSLAAPRTPRQLVIVAVRLVGSTAGRRLSERALAQGHAGPPVPPIGGSRTPKPDSAPAAGARTWTAYAGVALRLRALLLRPAAAARRTDVRYDCRDAQGVRSDGTGRGGRGRRPRRGVDQGVAPG